MRKRSRKEAARQEFCRLLAANPTANVERLARECGVGVKWAGEIRSKMGIETPLQRRRRSATDYIRRNPTANVQDVCRMFGIPRSQFWILRRNALGTHRDVIPHNARPRSSPNLPHVPQIEDVDWRFFANKADSEPDAERRERIERQIESACLAIRSSGNPRSRRKQLRRDAEGVRQEMRH